ncbi:unnamed protein product [Caenorhabditis nigoni]
MSDNIGPKELSNAFKYLLAYQLDSIASDGVMPSAHGALHKLLCSCYSKNTEVVEVYEGDNGNNAQETQDQYTKRAVSGDNNNKKAILQPPPPPLPTSSQFPSSDELKRRDEKVEKRVVRRGGDDEKKQQQSPIIVEVYDDTPHSKMMLSTVNNPYRGGGSNNNNSNDHNNSNHRMVIEDVTDDPEYSSYGNENEKPENEEEGAFVEYEKLDKTEDPAAYKVCQSTTAVNRTYNNIRPAYRMPIGGGSGSSSGSISREIRIESMNLNDVEDGARCRDKECRLGWKQHPWS